MTSAFKPLLARVLACALLSAAALACAAAPAAEQPVAAYVPDRVIVAFKEHVPAASRLALLNRHHLVADTARSSRNAGAARIPGPVMASGVDVQDIVSALRREPAVRVVEPDYIVSAVALPDDPSLFELWGLHNTGQGGGTPGADIDAEKAWDLSIGSESVIVGVLDTGVDYTHPDLADNILRDDSGAVIGYDFVNNDADPMDDHGHGTHVAGTIGARGNNGIGVTGVCQVVRIMPLKFLGANGRGATSDAIRALDFASTNGARVTNNSWGGSPRSVLFLEALTRAADAGSLFVCAAGNNGTDNGVTAFYPASYNRDAPNVVSVAASTWADTLVSWSCFGATAVDVAAPGVTTFSTVINGGYGIKSGTSMACPHVAGAAALALARFPDLTVQDLRSRVVGGVDYVAGPLGKVISGRINLAKIVADEPPLPVGPSVLTVESVSTGSVTLSWSHFSYPVTELRVQRWDGAAFTPIASLPPSAREFTDSTVAGGTIYHYRVIGTDGLVNSPCSNVVGVRTSLVGPDGIIAFPISVNTIELRWLDRSDETHWIVERSLTPGSGFHPIAILPGSHGQGHTVAHHDAHAHGGRRYYYRVVARTNGIGDSAPSPEANAAIPVGGRLSLSTRHLVIPAGAESQGLPLIITNSGTGLLTGLVQPPGGGFIVQGGGGYFALQPGESLQITVTFSGGAGAHHGTLWVFGSDGGPQPVSLSAGG